MKQIIVKLKNYKEELEAITAELVTLPDGSLVKRGKFYYHVINQKQVGITKNEKLKRKLCQKKYLLFQQKKLSKSILALERSLDKIHEVTDEETISSFTGAYGEMPNAYFFHPSMQKWLAEDYETNSYRKESLKFSSNNGIKLRSKSEVFIANQLESYHIPYRYDTAIKLGNRLIYPDFTIKSPYTGKIILWEHFGALHLAEYEKKMNDKMDLYLKSGYIPFETIIYTFESDAKKPERLKYLIENVIL